MAFTTNVYRNGQWVTQEVTFDQILRRREYEQNFRDRNPLPNLPKYGILASTIVESPLVHTILPARLRSAEHVDVIFIGDHFLRICELQTTRSEEPPNVSCHYHLQEIARKTDLGSRIRSAKVIFPIYDGDDKSASRKAKKEKTDSGMEILADDDLKMTGGSQSPDSAQKTSSMPPQLLALVLENGSCVFLCMRLGGNGVWQFESSTFGGPETRLWTPGFHFAVDPSSRYMALGCHESFLVVYELEDRETLEGRFARGESLSPVKSSRPRTVNGTIHKMEFLFPNPADDYHVILFLITIRDGRSRSIIYDWEVDEDLKEVLKQEKRGHSLPREHQMPLLIIPLAVCSAFFAISQDSIAVCKDILEGPPSFENFQLQEQEPTEFHHGSTHPLWTAWARPLRTKDHAHEAGQDHIYLAREDGALIFLQIEPENILGATVSLGLLNGNIATALASIPGPFADILLMGGDSGPGAMYEISPRGNPRPLTLMPNWSPAVDFATTNKFCPRDHGAKDMDDSPLCKDSRDRIFAASGRGVKGAITEFRTGIQGKIDVRLDVGQPVKKIWMLPVIPTDGTAGFHILITIPGASMLLLASEGLTDDVGMIHGEESPYDLSSPTLAADEVGDNKIVQVTEKFLVTITPGSHREYQLAELFNLPEMVVLDAVVHGGFVALSTHVGSAFQLRIMTLTSDMSLAVVGSSDVEGEVTCIACVDFMERPYLVAGIFSDDYQPVLSVLSVHDVGATFSAQYKVAKPGLNDAVNKQHQSEHRRFDDRVHSIICLPYQDTMTIVAGSRFGDVLTLNFAGNVDGPCKLITSHYDKVGARGVQLCLLDESPVSFSPLAVKFSILICCGLKAYLMTRLPQRTNRARDIHHFFPIDLEDPPQAKADLHWVGMPRQAMLHRLGGFGVFFASGSEILLAEMQPMPRTIPREIPMGATPTKLIYVPELDCLVVAVKIDDKVSLRFLDPVTGADLSRPGRQISQEEPIDADEAEHISGLGTPGDKVLDLSKWDFKKADGKKEPATWTYILVCLASGKLLVLSTKALPKNFGETRGKINFWTRLKKKCNAPVQCALGSGDNVFYCAGVTLHWEKLDPIAKGLKEVNTFQLRSPSTALRLVNDCLVVLTENESVQIIELSSDATTPGGSLVGSLRHSAPTSHDGAVHMIDIAPDIGDVPDEEDSADIVLNVKEYGEEPRAALNPDDKTIILFSDRACGVSAQWIPWKQPRKNCIPVMEARLPASIRKFARGLTRPCWQPVRTRENCQYGVIPTREDGAEVLGLCLDGSIQHFSLINLRAWKVLWHIQELWRGQEDKERRHYDDEAAMEPFDEQRLQFGEPLSWGELLSERHVDGDILRRALHRRGLMPILRKYKDVAIWMQILLTDLVGEEWMEKDKEVELGENKEAEQGDDTEAEQDEDGEVEMGGTGDENVKREKLRADEEAKFEKMLPGMVDLLYEILEYHLTPVL